jgi:flavin reductase (DIM6/NTAB) family NADH-FMN oxidoreductase RutF
MTVNSFNSLSLDPQLVLFSVATGAASLPLWRRAEGYAVNVLAENQKDMSDRFARSGVNKWEGTTYAEGLFGAPALPGVAAVLERSNPGNVGRPALAWIATSLRSLR